jgi:hypothetical protein
VEWWGPSRKIEQFDEGDRLLIRVTSLQRKGDYLLAGVGTLVAMLYCVAKGYVVGVVGVVAVGAVIAWSIASERVSELLVTRSGFEWQGSGWSNERRYVRWKDIFALRYESGGEDGPTGLCARTGRMTSKCIVNGVNPSESDAIVRMIYAKFPTLELGPEPEGFLSSFKRAFRGNA